MVFTISPNKPFIKQTGLGHVLNLGVIIFSSVFIKKTETDSNRPVSVQFFRTKTSSKRFGSVLARFVSVWVQFGLIFSVSGL